MVFRLLGERGVKRVFSVASSDNLITRIDMGFYELEVPCAGLRPLIKSHRWHEGRAQRGQGRTVMGTPEYENWYRECHQKVTALYPRNSLPSSLTVKYQGFFFLTSAKE
jgi:hypothetical protein